MVLPNFDEWGDSRLLASWREGNVEAGRELFARHYDTIYRFFDSKIKKNIQALIEDTFKDSINHPQTSADVRAALFNSATYRLYDHFSVECALEDLGSTDLSLQELGGHPSTMIEDEPGLQLFRSAITRIPLREQVLLEFCLSEELLSYPQIAGILNIDPSAIPQRIDEAQKHIELELTALEPDPARITATIEAFRDKLRDVHRRREQKKGL